MGFWNFVILNCFVLLLNFGFEEFFLFKNRFLGLNLVRDDVVGVVGGFLLVSLEVVEMVDVKFFEVVLVNVLERVVFFKGVLDLKFMIVGGFFFIRFIVLVLVLLFFGIFGLLYIVM